MMKVRKFAAAEMTDALCQIRQELGPDAIILHAKQGDDAGFWKLFRRPSVEVVAALDDDEPTAPPTARTAIAGTTTAVPEIMGALRDIQRAIAELRTRIDVVAARSDAVQVAYLGDVLGAYYRHLRDQDVGEAVAYDIVHRVFQRLNPTSLLSPAAVDARIKLELGELIHTARSVRLTPGEPRVLFFVGPTGTGKTTLVAKLAAGFTLNEQRRVALIASDTIRVAAVPQLCTYGEIMGLEVDVAYSEAELQILIRSHHDKDLVLIDTPGRSARNGEGIAEVGSFVRQVPGATIYLVLAATAKASDLIDAAAAFEPCGYSLLAATKLDETARLGPLVDLAAESERLFAFFSADQEVPGEIAVASSEDLVDRLLAGLDLPERTNGNDIVTPAGASAAPQTLPSASGSRSRLRVPRPFSESRASPG